MHRHSFFTIASGALLAVGTASCSLLVDADRFNDEQGDAGTGNMDGPAADARASDASIDLASACDGRDPLLFGRDRFVESNGPLLLDRLGTYVLDTDDAVRILDPDGEEIKGHTVLIETSDDGSEFLLVVVDSLSIRAGATLRAKGSRPLHFAAAGTIDLQGSIDVSSNDSGVGAGGNTALGCTDGGNGANGGAGEGGGGGGFKARGGDGGIASLFAAAAGGMENTQDLSLLLRGGCRGGDGSKGQGGSGGGAVMLLACDTIHFGGTITAYGQGGLGADAGLVAGGGGGGGGAGGFVGFDTPLLMVDGGGFEQRIFLGGGGGGGGAGNLLGQSGLDGQDGGLAGGEPGSGGNNGGNGGRGGVGAAPMGGNGVNGSLGGGGGGGGGSAGHLLDLSGPRV